MNMKRTVIALLLALVMVFSLVSCGDRDKDNDDDGIKPPQSGIEGPIIDWEPDPQ